jgi:hypothetical protein
LRTASIEEEADEAAIARIRPTVIAEEPLSKGLADRRILAEGTQLAVERSLRFGRELFLQFEGNY